MGNSSAITLRRAEPDDVPAIAGILIDTWRRTFRGLLPDSFLNELSEAVQIDRYRKRMALKEHICSVALKQSGEFVGFVSAGPCRHAGPTIYPYELYALYVKQHAQGIGLGRALFQAMATSIPFVGGGGLMVWVLENNPHRGFYQHLGGREFTRASVSLNGQNFTEIAYGWSAHPSPP
jgi:L-amino acid N-acyltransferase YncA